MLTCITVHKMKDRTIVATRDGGYLLALRGKQWICDGVNGRMEDNDMSVLFDVQKRELIESLRK